jgi:hypothetical protein
VRVDLGNRREINIFRLDYRSGVNGRLARAWIKAPYSTMYVLTELLTRQLTHAVILWYRLRVATPKEIAEHRTELARPMDALRASSDVTKVDWNG